MDPKDDTVKKNLFFIHKVCHWASKVMIFVKFCRVHCISWKTHICGGQKVETINFDMKHVWWLSLLAFLLIDTSLLISQSRYTRFFVWMLGGLILWISILGVASFKLIFFTINKTFLDKIDLILFTDDEITYFCGHDYFFVVLCISILLNISGP